MCSAATPLLRFGGRRAVCLRGNRVIAGRRRVSVAPPYCGLEVGFDVVLGALSCEWGGWQRANHLVIMSPFIKVSCHVYHMYAHLRVSLHKVFY
jgi:hypothetical protein